MTEQPTAADDVKRGPNIVIIPDPDVALTQTDDPLVSAELMASAEGEGEVPDLPPAAPESTPTIRLTIDLPASVAVALKHRARNLDSAEAASLVVQLYHTAPLERRPVILTESEHARICTTLGFTPRTNEELVGAVESLTAISFGGLRVKLTAEDVELINARNATEMPPKEFADYIVKLGFEAWKNGLIG